MQPFRKTSIDQNSLSLIGLVLWNKTPEEVRRTTSLNTFKHNLQKHFLMENGKSSFSRKIIFIITIIVFIINTINDYYYLLILSLLLS